MAKVIGMECDGFWLSVEAIVSLALLGLLISMDFHAEGESLMGLHVFKKENDLLLAWVKGFDSFSGEKAVQDLAFAFPGKSCSLFVDGQKILEGKGSEGISAGVKFFGKNLELHELSLIVFNQD